MFTIVKEALAWWPVVWPGLTEDGQPVSHQIEMQFRLLKLDEVTAFQTRSQDFAAQINGALSADERDKASAIGAGIIKLIATNWRGVAVEGDAGEVPWSDDHLRLLVNEPNVFDAIVRAWRDCMAAGPRIREGN